MQLFTANQVNHVYVVGKITDQSYTNPQGSQYVQDSNMDEGDLVVRSTFSKKSSDKTTPDGRNLYFVYKGKGGIIRTDLVKIDDIEYINYANAASMYAKSKVATVVLDSSVNQGLPVAGQDYILRIAFTNYVGISPEDSQYWKYAMVHAYTNMTASDFYKKMAISLAKSMSREATKLITIKLGYSTNSTDEVTASTTETSLNQTYTKLILEEVQSNWIRGLKQQKTLKFDVATPAIEILEGSSVSEVPWGTVTYADTTIEGNGKLMADYEYFWHGEMGDQYRMVGWPDYIPTEYMVDPSKDYDVVSIHYSYVGENESVQKSEKDMTFLFPAPGANETSLAGLFFKALYAFATENKGSSNTGSNSFLLKKIRPEIEGHEEISDIIDAYEESLAENEPENP